MNKRFALFALVLTVFVLYTRVKCQAQYLYSWDSISFALSIENYNMRLHQPHPPGYILYSYTIRVLNSLIGDPNRTMIYMNIAATLGACYFLARLVLTLGGNTLLAAGASALYAVNPVAAFYGSVAEIYAIEGFWVVLIAYLLLASRKQPNRMVWASVAMAAAGGFRPTTEVFLLPLFVACCFARKKQILITALVALVIGNLLWFAPLVVKSGGLNNYLDAVRGQSERAVESGSEAGEQVTWAKLLLRVIQAVTIPVLIALFVRIHHIRFTTNGWLLLLAVLPPLLLFSFFHFPKDGYLLVFIPLLIAISVTLLNGLYPVRIQVAILSLACVLSWLSFVMPIENHPMLAEFTRPNHEILQSKMNRLTQFFQITAGLGGGRPKTFVLENRHFFPNWRTLMYYYPEDRVYLVWPNKKRAYFASRHEYTTIAPPVRVPKDSVLIAVGRTQPSFALELFQIEQFRYYFSEAHLLPENFQLYSMKCMVSGKE
jgi:hypothetical protein